jgi:uncharacterized membrane protein YqjE
MNVPRLRFGSELHWLQYLLPIGLYLLAITAFRFLGFDTTDVPWWYYQILDREAITIAPVRSLFLLHSQPPLLNTILAFFIRLSELVGVDLNTLITYLFYTLGGISTLLLYFLIFDMTSSWALAGCAIALMLSDPGYHFFQHRYFYPFILHFLLIVVMFFIGKVLRTCKFLFLYGSIAAIALISNTSSLFHPVWAVLYYLLLLYLLSILHGPDRILRRKQTLIASLIFITLLIAWPLKNLFVFNTFSFSSWTGFNLSRETPVQSNTLSAYLAWGEVSDQTKANIKSFAIQFGEDQIKLLTQPTKSDGSRNWNHYVFIETNDYLAKEAIQWRISHPNAWIATALANYGKWTRPTYVHPYTDEIRGPTNTMYVKYTQAHRQLFFADVGRYLEALYPGVINGPITLFGTVTLPSLTVLTFLVFLVRWRYVPRRLSVETSMLILAGIVVAWVLIVPSLTDGIEGNRMRFCVTPCLLVMTVVVVKEVSDYASRLASMRS